MSWFGKKTRAEKTQGAVGIPGAIPTVSAQSKRDGVMINGKICYNKKMVKDQTKPKYVPYENEKAFARTEEFGKYPSSVQSSLNAQKRQYDQKSQSKHYTDSKCTCKACMSAKYRLTEFEVPMSKKQ